jgi:hypothetical protein
MSRKRSPQEKKSLSYARDCRNTYGENAKASRKAIPKRKAAASRVSRHAVATDLRILPRVDEASADLIDSSARSDTHRVGGWQKGADQPLGEIVKRKREREIGRFGNKPH